MRHCEDVRCVELDVIDIATKLTEALDHHETIYRQGAAARKVSSRNLNELREQLKRQLAKLSDLRELVG